MYKDSVQDGILETKYVTFDNKKKRINLIIFPQSVKLSYFPLQQFFNYNP